MKFYRDKIYTNINYNIIFSNKLDSIFQNIKNNVYFYKKGILNNEKNASVFYNKTKKNFYLNGTYCGNSNEFTKLSWRKYSKLILFL